MSHRTPRRRLLRRWLGLALGLAALVVGIAVAGIAGAQPANAAVWDFCKADQTFAAPLPADVTTSGPVKVSITDPAAGSQQFRYVTTTERPVDAYGGAGLSWTTFGASCADFAESGATMVANFIYEFAVATPARLLGLLLQLVFAPTLADLVIGDGTAAHPGALGGALESMHSGFFLTWAPLLIGLGLCGALWNMARKRSQKGISSFVWLMAVIVAIGILASPSGMKILRKTNDAASDATVCATFAVSGACSDSNTDSTTSRMHVFEAMMTETLAAPVWASGALGDLAAQPFTNADGSVITSIKYTSDLNGVPDFGGDLITVPIHVLAVPSKGATPTWGEVWRWTGTYTADEMAAIRDDDSLRCTDKDSPKTSELSNRHADGAESHELCRYKAVVRAALLYKITTEHEGSLPAVMGSGNGRLIAAISGAAAGPLELGIGVMGLLTLGYQLELIFLVLMAPLVALIALKRPEAAKQWGGKVTATLVRRVAVGLTLGIVLWLTTTINQGFVNLVTGPGAVATVNPVMIPVVTATVGITVMIAGFVGLGHLKDMLLAGLALPTDDPVTGGLEKAATVATVAAGGALGAASGARLLGAGKALLRSGAVGGPTVGRGMRTVEQLQAVRGTAGQRLDVQDREHERSRREEEAARAQKRRTPPVMPGGGAVPPHREDAPPPGPRAEDGPDAATAWADLLSTEAAQAQRAAHMRPHEERHATAVAGMRRVEDELAHFAAARREREQRRYNDLIAEGHTPEAAARKAAEAIDGQAQHLAAALQRARQGVGDAEVDLDVARRTPTRWEVAADAHLRGGSSLEEATAALHLDRVDHVRWLRAQNAIRPDPER